MSKPMRCCAFFFTPLTVLFLLFTSPAYSQLNAIVSEAQFRQIFPNRNGFYTYWGMVNAANAAQGFARSGDWNTRKFEAAAFLANVFHETGGLVYVEQIHKEPYCDYGAWNWAPCNGGWYYGRGPLQLSWNYNYKMAGDHIGVNLLKWPHIVNEDPKVSWQVAMWFWMTQRAAGWDTMHNHAMRWNFGETIRTINGGQECGWNPPNPWAAQERAKQMRRISRILGVSDGGRLGC